MKRALLGLTMWMMCCLSACPPPAFCQEEYQFNLSEIEKEIEKKPYSIGGFVEFRPVLFGLDRSGASYQMKFRDEDRGATEEQYNFGLRLEGSFEKGPAGAYLRTDSSLRHGYQGWSDDITLSEGYLSLKPNPSFILSVGKKAVQWGKGYAFNPVAFVSRPKDTENPTEALEGYYMITADLIKSFRGPLQTLAFTPVLLPVTRTINQDFGEQDGLNLAAKLYLLLWDTDVDLVLFTGDSRTTRYGLDFAKNLKTNFEIHGEMARITDFDKKGIDTDGSLSTHKSDVMLALLGIRYLTANEVTFIIEYYHNGGGIGENDARNFFRFVDLAYDVYTSTGDASRLAEASQLYNKALAESKPMRDYLYCRASWKEPFDILYFTPSVTSIVNLADWSLSFSPEFVYSPKTNLEFKLLGAFLMGGEHTEYGEKQYDYKIELRIRHYF